VRLSIFLLFLSVLCVVLLMNCLLKDVAICFAVVFSLLPKVIVLLGCCTGCLFESVLIVFQNM